MEDSFRISLFAHDLMNFVLSMSNIDVRLPISETVRTAMSTKSPFNDVIGVAVFILKDNNMTMIQEEYKKVRLYEYEVNVGRWAMQRVVSFCSEGYEPRKFLLYTSVVVGMACIFSRHDRVGIVKLLAEVLASVLTSYVMTTEFDKNGGFEMLTRAADALLDIMEGKMDLAVEATEEAAVAGPERAAAAATVTPGPAATVMLKAAARATAAAFSISVAAEATSGSEKAAAILTPEGAAISAPEGAAISAPEGVAISAPEGVAISAPEGVAISAPEGAAISAPKGAAISATEGAAAAASSNKSRKKKNAQAQMISK